MNSLATRTGLAREEKHLRWALIAGVVSFVVEAAIYVPQVFEGPASTRPYAINSVAKDCLFAALTALVAADLIRRIRLIWLVVWGHVVIVLMLTLTLVTGDTAFTFPPPRWMAGLADLPAGSRNLVWLIGAVVAIVLLVVLIHRALRARYQLEYLWPIEHAALSAVAGAILEDPVFSPDEIAIAVDRYWAKLDIGYKRRLRLALWVVNLLPLIFLRPPLSMMELTARRKFIKARLHDIGYRSDLGLLRSTVQSAYRFAMQLTYMGYYKDPRTFAKTGYERFSDRPDYPDPPPAQVNPDLRILPEPQARRSHMKTDVLIIGTGAGGSIAAHVLTQRGREVMMVDRGRYAPPAEFGEDEAEQYAKLYSDGALQLSRDFTFQVLQGMCVGGSTVVNNGVCFKPLPDVFDRWRDEFDAKLDRTQLDSSYAEVRRLIGASVQNGVNLRHNPVTQRLRGKGFKPVEANLDCCLGCGYCNIGCGYNRKLSMLVKVLPETQKRAGERLKILPRCEVTAITHRNGRATGASAQIRSDDGKTRTLEIEADLVVLAAGAIHSSRILMASEIGDGLVGQGLSANLGSHMTAFWSEGPPIRAFDGLQMSDYLDAGPPGYRIETWFNPVMSQALVMPGWMKDHQRNMERYDRLACLGVIAGSTRNGNHVMSRPNFLSGAEIDFTPSTDDLRKLLKGLRHAGELLLSAGADCVMPATFVFRSVSRDRPEELTQLDVGKWVQDATDISVNTGHPQGGNPMSGDPTKGVVDEAFKVRDLENLYICDASVFPTAVTVNPQLTVMALAHYAATHHIGV